jgi:hypothetical protein
MFINFPERKTIKKKMKKGLEKIALKNVREKQKEINLKKIKINNNKEKDR